MEIIHVLQEIKFGRAVLLSTVDGGVDLEVTDGNPFFHHEKAIFTGNHSENHRENI